MPELAEVETVREVLKKQILNKKITDIKILYPKMIENDLFDFKNSILNQEFIDIKRKGKYLIFETNDNYLISHLRMEGKFFVKDAPDEYQKHEHIIFEMDNTSLSYHDTRKFGRMKLIPKKELDSYFKNIGPDANSNIDSNYLYKKIKNKSLPIKTILLDQSIIAGIGNIYADEILFASKINPLKQGKNISLNECELILKNSKLILDQAIKYKGTTIKSYTSSLNVFGQYQNYLKVHTKKICPYGHEISKIKINGRSTYYCKICQDNL